MTMPLLSIYNSFILWTHQTSIMYIFPRGKSALAQLLIGRCFCRGLYTPPPFPGGLRADSDGLDLSRMPNFWLWNGWNCPVTFRWLSGACLPDWSSPTDFPTDWLPEYHQASNEIPPEMTRQQQKVQQKSGRLQRTLSRQPSLLILLIKIRIE